MKPLAFVFNLVRPCTHCPFRKDITPFLDGPRAEEIAQSLEDSTFACHETVHRAQPRDARGRFKATQRSHCAGALIIMARSGEWGDMQQLAQRLGLFDPRKLDMSAPAFDSLQEFVRANGGSIVKWRTNPEYMDRMRDRYARNRSRRILRARRNAGANTGDQPDSGVCHRPGEDADTGTTDQDTQANRHAGTTDPGTDADRAESCAADTKSSGESIR